jgi:hypothetical protein
MKQVTFRLVAQCLNQLHHSVPRFETQCWIKYMNVCKQSIKHINPLTPNVLQRGLSEPFKNENPQSKNSEGSVAQRDLILALKG